jgi:hypothetical protein
MQNANMTSDKKTPDGDADLQAVVDAYASGKPIDPEIAKRIRERGKQIRQEIFQQHGVLDIGVPAIRELRGDVPEK